MDDLKRWRDERAARQTARLLMGYRDPEEEAVRPGRSQGGHLPPKAGTNSSKPGSTRRISSSREAREIRALREARAIRELGPLKNPPTRGSRGGFRIWPVPERVSPVHPEWDDPTGGRFKWAFYRALAIHIILIPSFFLVSRVPFPNFGPSIPRDRVFLVGIAPPAAGGGGKPSTAPPRPPRAPKTEKKVPAQPTAPKPATVKPTPAVKKAAPPVVKPRRDVAAVPRPVKDKEIAAEERESETTGRETRDTRRSPSPEPVTDPIAREGPLLVGVGPVAGSGASINGVDGVDFPFNSYLELVRGKIAQAWQVPQNYVSKGRRLETMVRFRINRDGSVAEASIEEPSHFDFYDQAALRAVVSVRRFPPLPQEFGGQFLVVHFEFTFTGR